MPWPWRLTEPAGGRAAGLGALQTLTVRVNRTFNARRVAAGRHPPGLRWLGPAARGCPAMLARRPGRQLALLLRRALTAATRQRTSRAGAGARATRPALLGVPDRPAGCRLPPGGAGGLRREDHQRCPRGRRHPAGAICGAPRSAARGGSGASAGGEDLCGGAAAPCAEPSQPPRGASIAGQSRAAGPAPSEPRRVQPAALPVTLQPMHAHSGRSTSATRRNRLRVRPSSAISRPRPLRGRTASPPAVRKARRASPVRRGCRYRRHGRGPAPRCGRRAARWPGGGR